MMLLCLVTPGVSQIYLMPPLDTNEFLNF